MKHGDSSTNDGAHFKTPCDDGDLLSQGGNHHAADGQNIRETFAKNLRLWRTWRDIPMKVIASDVGVNESTYCLWEAGKRFPNAENLNAIAMYAGLPICRFFKNGESSCGRQPFEEIGATRSVQSSPDPMG